MPRLDLSRYANITHEEWLRRIGELIATAVIRCYRDHRAEAALDPADGKHPKSGEPTDETEKEMLGYLAWVGAATPRGFQIALGLSPMTVTRRLFRLRAAKLVVSTGKTRAARYELRARESN